MIREFYLILVSVFLFVAINTVFYIQILNQQLEFQTDLLARQTQICGNTIEREGEEFENELRSIPYEHDFTRLFTDEEIRQTGSVHLQKLYAGYSQLINKITVYDNTHNVYSLILDNKNNFVSDYYESQRQISLLDRDDLTLEGNKYLLHIPGFDEDGVVRSNITVDLNYNRFVEAIFESYGLEETIWQWLVSSDGKLVSTASGVLDIPEADLLKVSQHISEIEEGSMVHTIGIDSLQIQVVSAYYPVRLVNRDLGIVFSMKTDLFQRSIVIKMIIISFCSLLLLAIMLYIHFRVRRSKQIPAQKLTHDSFLDSIDGLPFGLMFINSEGNIMFMNRLTRDMIVVQGRKEPKTYADLGFDTIPGLIDGTIYHKSFGKGNLLLIHRAAELRFVYKMELNAELDESEVKIILLLDVSEIESFRNSEKLTQQTRGEMIENMIREISVPLKEAENKIRAGKDEGLKNDFSQLSNMLNATLDFARQSASAAVTEEIPFFIHSEIDIALAPFRDKNESVSIINKILNDVPEKLLGDPFRLRQVISNLMENSMTTTKEGRILLTCEVKERVGGLLRLHISVEDTGEGLPEGEVKSVMQDLHTGRISPQTEKDPLRRRLAIAKQNIKLMRGQFWMDSPSSISTSPDMPGVKYGFTLEVFPGENIKENIIFRDIFRIGEIESLILSQEKETEEERITILLDLGLKPRHLVYRAENTESLFDLVSERKDKLHMLIIIHTETQDGFSLAEGIIRKGLNENLILVLLSTIHKYGNQAISRSAGVDYYFELPMETSLCSEMLKKHFPDLEQKEMDKIPELEKIKEGMKILLAEDNLFNRKLIQGLFKRLGVEIDLAENGAQAIELARKTRYDIVFLDLVMPEMDGMQAAAEIKKLDTRVPIIALTALNNEEARKKALKKGFSDYLIKPASEESLRKILLTYTKKSG